MGDIKKYKETVYKIIGAAMKVHSELNWGLLESVYQEALTMELEECGVEFEAEKEVCIFYKNKPMKKKYRMDLVVGDIICELKSATEIMSAHRAQLCNYLRLTKKPLGLLINFGAESLEGERWAYDESTNECYLVDVKMNPLYLEKLNVDYDDDDL